MCQTKPLALYNIILFKCNDYINDKMTLFKCNDYVNDKMTYLNHQVLTFCNVKLFLN